MSCLLGIMAIASVNEPLACVLMLILGLPMLPLIIIEIVYATCEPFERSVEVDYILKDLKLYHILIAIFVFPLGTVCFLVLSVVKVLAVFVFTNLYRILNGQIVLSKMWDVLNTSVKLPKIKIELE
jgi:hypothetical protein